MKNRKKPADSVKVYFPCIHAGTTGEFLSVTCFKSQELKGIVKVVLGVDDETARTIIGAGRHGERGPEVGEGVMMLFSNPLFSGRSYGLSMVVADKLARYGKAAAATRIYATGEIPVDGCGRVDPVEGCTEKLHLLKKTLSPGSLLLLPQANVSSSQQNRALIENLMELGIECIAISHIDELNGVVWKADSSLFYEDTLQKLKTFFIQPDTLKSAGVLLSVFLFIALLYLIAGKTAPKTAPPASSLAEQQRITPVIPPKTKALFDSHQQDREQSTHQKAVHKDAAPPSEKTPGYRNDEAEKRRETDPVLESVVGNPAIY
ncbi:MAG: hypothetical protein CSA32_04160 [Desulfobulbus propionicus]|nr:MAG: hypothetical protein CSA32_04160 [Desulfobulbus propionicus]